MKKVLFVCRENSKRSQLAEALANTQFEGIVAVSAGTEPAENIDPTARALIKTFDPKIKHYYPKNVSNFTGEFDAIITLGCEVDPSRLPKSDLVQDWPTSDPQTFEDFERVISFLKERIGMLLQQIS